MKSWRQIFSWREEPTLPNGFGKSVVAHSFNNPGADYAGVCLYMGKDNTYALWSDSPTGDEDSFNIDLIEMREKFEGHEFFYLRKVREALEITDEAERHLALTHISGVTWLYTDKCEFIED